MPEEAFDLYSTTYVTVKTEEEEWEERRDIMRSFWEQLKEVWFSKTRPSRVAYRPLSFYEGYGFTPTSIYWDEADDFLPPLPANLLDWPKVRDRCHIVLPQTWVAPRVQSTFKPPPEPKWHKFIERK